MDYVKYFNLSDRPFKNTYDGRFFFRTQDAELVFETLRDDGCPPIVHLKGHPKTGKTSVLRRLPAELRETRKLALILNPHLTLIEIFRQALTDFGHSHKFTIHTPEEELLGYFQNAVSDFLNEGFRLILAVDNAEELPPETLAELYGLMEMEPEWAGRVILLLCGSPDSPWPVVPDIMLEVKELVLRPLDPAGAEEYVQFRLKAAGGGQLITKGALKSLWEYSQGLPETINQLAERSLIAAWSAGRREAGTAQMKAARASLDHPLSLDQEALDQAARGQALRSDVPHRTPSSLARPLLLIALIGGLGAALYLNLRPAPELALEVPPEGEVLIAETEEPAPTATPAGPGSAAETAGVKAPTLAAPPPQLMGLPQGSLALVIDQDAPYAQLWQGGLKGPGKKADVAVPRFQNGGLYLIGRPRTNNPLIFQYPPAREIPREEAKIIWPRVSTLLPQNILPVIVAGRTEYDLPKDEAAEEAIRARVKAWVQSQQYRFPDTMAALYAGSFKFFELGRPDRTVDREDFRRALNSEARTSGEVHLAVSQPLIMQDPVKPNLIWAIFNLKYESKLRNDMGLRVLVFDRGGMLQDSWLIVAELWLPEKSLRGE